MSGQPRPLNAPPAGQLAFGVQPGVTPARGGVGSGPLVGVTSLFYNGTPAAGNLVLSNSDGPGTDRFGNAYQGPGWYVYGTGAAGAAAFATMQVNSNGSVTLTMRPSASPAPASIAASAVLTAAVLSPGTATEREQVTLNSGLETGGGNSSSVVATSESHDLGIPALIQLITTTVEVDSAAPVIQLNPSTATHLTAFPSFSVQVTNPGTLNEQMLASFFSGTSNSNDSFGIQLNDESANGLSNASGGMTIGGALVFDFAGNSLTGLATCTIGGILFNVVNLVATQGTPAQPTIVTTDSWQTATLINAWAGSGAGGVNGLRYRMTTDQEIEFELDIINAAALGSSTCYTFPAGVYRSTKARNFPAGWNHPQANNSATVPWVFYDGSGNLIIAGIQVANIQIFARGKIPLT